MTLPDGKNGQGTTSPAARPPTVASPRITRTGRHRARRRIEVIRPPQTESLIRADAPARSPECPTAPNSAPSSTPRISPGTGPSARNFEPSTLWHSDNLPVLRGINTATVDLIATDPPFNKSKDFHASPNALKAAQGARFEDRWRWHEDVQQSWIDGIKDQAPAVWAVVAMARTVWGDDMAAFLCWLGVRLMECHRVLKPSGSLYLHIDHTAHAYAKALLDAIFERRQFRNEIIWCYTGPGNVKKWFPRKHDIILFYTATDAYSFNHDAVRIPYKSGLHNTGQLFHVTDGNNAQVREKEREGKLVEDWWTDIGAGSHIPKNQRTGYPTQKPLALYERIIQASSGPDDLVLDPFAGCATTLIAAQRLGRQWVGIDIWKGAADLVVRRLATGDRPEKSGPNNPAIQTEAEFFQVHQPSEPPVRSDQGETAAEPFFLVSEHPPAPWERLTHAEIRDRLESAQEADPLTQRVVCAGCGRSLEAPFMELDHRTPKKDGGAHTIDNRVLLCRPCNGYKHDELTVTGLHKRNRREGWPRPRRSQRRRC